jgi:hypothetical protein
MEPGEPVENESVPHNSSLVGSNAEAPARKAITFRGIGPDAVLRADEGTPGAPRAPHRRTWSNRETDRMDSQRETPEAPGSGETA